MKSLFITIFCLLFLLTSCELKNESKSNSLNASPDIGMAKSLLNNNQKQSEEESVDLTKETENQNLEKEKPKTSENQNNSSSNYTSTNKADITKDKKKVSEKPINDSNIIENELPSKPEEVITSPSSTSDDCTIKETTEIIDDKNKSEIEEDIILQPAYNLPSNFTDAEGIHFEYYWTETEVHSRFLELWDLRKDCRWHSRYFDDEETEYYELMWED